MVGNSCCGRQHSSDVLRCKAKQLREQADRLDQIADAVQSWSGEPESSLHDLLWDCLRKYNV